MPTPTATRPDSPITLEGDPDALYMATPPEAAARLACRLPPGRVLELCCGIGGLTTALARRGPMVAVDKSPERIAMARANLARLGLETNVSFICGDLDTPPLRPRPGLFRLVIMDPDWSAAGDSPSQWTDELALMRPNADRLIRWAQGWKATIIARLPVGQPHGRLIQYGYFHRLHYKADGRAKFTWVIWGN